MFLEDFPIAKHGSILDGESIELFLDRWRVNQGLGKKPSTRKFHTEIIETIRRNLTNLSRHPSALDEKELLEFAEKVAHYTPSRWNAIVTVLRHVTGKPKLLRYRKLRFRDFRPPSQEEFTALLIECDSAPKSVCGLVVRLLALTGMRIGEARKLRWVHVRENELALPGEITKNSQPRSIPLLPGVREILSRLQDVSPGEFVLPCADVRTALKKACRRAGVRHMSYHDLRHYFATKCVEAGASLFIISKWLGHSDGGTLAGRLYCHLTDEHSRRQAEKVRIVI
jgi:integrase